MTSRYVEWYWTVRWDLTDQPAYVAEVLPYPERERHLRGRGPSHGRVRHRGGDQDLPARTDRRGRAFGIKFWPGGFGAFTGRDVGAFLDREVPLADVFDDAGRLTDLVLAEDTDVRRRAVVEAYLADRIAGRPEDPSYELVLRIVRVMADERELTRVDQLTERFDVGIRTMQRLFRRYVGAGPKWVLRRYRLQDGAHLLAQGTTPSWPGWRRTSGTSTRRTSRTTSRPRSG